MVIDISQAFEVLPPPIDFIWPGFIAGTVGALVAPGATGKSYWALQAAMSVACHVPDGDLLGLEPNKPGKVHYLAGEDPIPVLQHRIHAIGRHLNADARNSIATNLAIESLVGQKLDLMDKAQLTTLIDKNRGSRLIVLDTLSRIHHLDENSNGDMGSLIVALEQLADQTGAGVLFLHHASKSSAREGMLDQQHAARGASAIVEQSRWASYLSKMTEVEAKRLTENNGKHSLGSHYTARFVRFGVSKVNYDAMPSDKWFERHEGGVLRPVRLLEAAYVPKTSQRRDTL